MGVTRERTGQVAVQPAWDDYVEFRRRALHRMADLAGLEQIDEHGMIGAIAPTGPGRGGLLVVEPGVRDRLFEVLHRGLPQWVGFLHPDAAVLQRLADEGWDAVQAHHAMSMPRLADLQPAPLPEGFTAVEVAVRSGRHGFPLRKALEVQLEHSRDDIAAPARDLQLEARLLRSLSVRFFAAVSDEGACVGTAGSRVVDASALVAAVVTVPEYRRRGLGTAMTCRALEAAREDGAVDAYLDATPAGATIYRRLGFSDLGTVVYCERSQA
jgi:GNAT superfamily N-acetyltransferase